MLDIDLAPVVDPFTGSVVSMCRYGRWQSGSPERLRLDASCLRVGKDRSDGLDALDLCIDARTALRQLRFSPAKWMASDALQYAMESGAIGGTAAGISRSLLAQLAYEECDLVEAERLARQIMRHGECKVPLQALVIVYPLLSRVQAHRCGPAAAARYLLEGEQTGEERNYPKLTAVCLRDQVERYGNAGDLDAARLSLRRLEKLACRQATAPSGQASGIASEHALARAQLALRERPSAAACETIRCLHREAVDRGDLYSAMQLALRLVDAQGAVGNTQEASRLLLELLRTGVNRGVLQSVVDAGTGVRNLLDTMSHNGAADVLALGPLVRTVLRRLKPHHDMPTPRTAREQPQAGLLTAREQAVLRSIGRGLSNKAIARELGIAPETVKSHAKHIFVKLGVQTRAQAVTRAVQLGLG
jgi:ATP/maltotriose-dependent transcriptional regulator MalT